MRLPLSVFVLSRVVNVRAEVATVRSSRTAKPRSCDQHGWSGTWQKQHNASRSNKRPASAGQGERQRLTIHTRKSGRRSSNSGFSPEHLRHRGKRSSSSSSVGPLGSVSDHYDDDEDAEMYAKSLCVPRAVNKVELLRREAQGSRLVSAADTWGFGDDP